MKATIQKEISYDIFVDGQKTGYTVMAETAEVAVATVLDDWSFWMAHLGRFKVVGEKGTVTCKGPVRFPDGYQDVYSG